MSRIESFNTHKFDKENQVSRSNTTTEFKENQKLIIRNQTKPFDSSISTWLKSVVNNEANTDILGSLYQEFIALVKKYPEAHKDKPKFNAIREYIIENLSTSLRYSNDHRLLEIWLKDPLLPQNFDIVFDKMMSCGVCKHWSSLYITFSECAQKAGRLDKAKYFCQIGVQNKAEPLKALLNRIEEVETLINIELKTKKKNSEANFKSENFKCPSSTLIFSSATKKLNTTPKDIYGPDIPLLKISHTEADCIKNPKYFESFTKYHDDNSYLRKVPNERTMSRCFMKGKNPDETYEELRARVYSSRKSADKNSSILFSSPASTQNRNRAHLGSSYCSQSIIPTPDIANNSSLISKNSGSKNRVQALRFNSNTSIVSNSDRIQFSSQPSSTPRGSIANHNQSFSQPNSTHRSSLSSHFQTASQSNITPREPLTNHIQISSHTINTSINFTHSHLQPSSQLSNTSRTSISNRIQASSQSSNTSISFTPNRIQTSSQLSNTSSTSVSNRIQSSSPVFSIHTNNLELSQERHTTQSYFGNIDAPTSSQISNVSSLSQHSGTSDLNRARIFSQPPTPMELEMPSFVSQGSEIDMDDISNISGFEPNTTIGFTNISLHQTPTSVRNRNLQRQTITPYPDPEFTAQCTDFDSQSKYNGSQHDQTFSQERTLQLEAIINGIPLIPRKRGSYINMFNRDSSPDAAFVVYRDP